MPEQWKLGEPLPNDCYLGVTVNCVGVMGKGIALVAKQRYMNENQFNMYRMNCFNKRLIPGGIMVTGQFVLMATKDHWRNPSELEWVRNILQGLIEFSFGMYNQTLLLPKLGCGNGGLDWETQVKPLVELAIPKMGWKEVIIL